MALLSYPLALILWQGATLALYLFSIRAICGERRDRLWLLLALAFPAVFINIGHGQNGFLTAGLVSFALVTLERRPLLAGVLFGLLAYKPQFGLMIPLVLLVTGQWRAIAAAAATVAVLALATLVAFGPDIWQAFFVSTPFTRSVVLEHGAIDWYKLQSVFSWVRMWGGPIGLAYVIQAAVTVSVAAGLAWLWRSRARFALKAAALPVATLLATPFCFDYDLMLLAPVIGIPRRRRSRTRLCTMAENDTGGIVDRSAGQPLGGRRDVDSAHGSAAAAGFRIYVAPRHPRRKPAPTFRDHTLK
jgi:hypothetical protein